MTTQPLKALAEQNELIRKMKIEIISLALVFLTLGLCSCNNLKTIRVPSINPIKGTNDKNIEKPNPSSKETKKENTTPDLKKYNSSEKTNTSPQINPPKLPRTVAEPEIVPPSDPEEKKPVPEESPEKKSILKPKLPARETVLPPS